MNVLLILLSSVILLTGCVKLSTMPRKISLVWGLFWGLVGWLVTIFFSGMTRPEVNALMNLNMLSTLEFIDLMIMASYLFLCGLWKKIIGFYPGLMIIVPVAMVSMSCVGMFPGMSFTLIGLVVGCVMGIAIIGLGMFLRHMKADEQTLYPAIIVAALSNVLIYGLI